MLDNMSFMIFFKKKIQLIDSVNVEPMDPESWHVFTSLVRLPSVPTENFPLRIYIHDVSGVLLPQDFPWLWGRPLFTHFHK